MHWNPPYEFLDVQRRGPYRLWEHKHRFDDLAGGTLVTDIVDYAVPGGALVNRLVVRPDLDRIFDYRARRLDAWALAKTRERSESPVAHPATSTLEEGA